MNGEMSIAEIAKYVRIPESEVLLHRSPAVGRTEEMWRCGRTGRISEGEWDCNCDSVFCSLGEWVTVKPRGEEVG